MHNQAAPGLGKIGVLVALSSKGDKAKLGELGRQLAMHIAAAAPQVVTADQLDATMIEKERAIYMEQAKADPKNAGKSEANLAKALSFVQDCEAAYREANDKVRRQFNQAFFKRLLIDDDYNVTGELAEPFDILLSEEVRQAAVYKAELDLTAAVNDAFRQRADQEASETEPVARELALAGAATASRTRGTVRNAQGLKEKTMVGVTGLEPVTSAV